MACFLHLLNRMKIRITLCAFVTLFAIAQLSNISVYTVNSEVNASHFMNV